MIRLLALAAVLTALISGVLLVAGDANGTATRNPECAVKNPPDAPTVKKGLNGRIISITGKFENRCVLPVARLGIFACLERQGKPKQCWANEKQGSAAIALTITHKCDYTTYKYEWSIEGYGYVQYFDGSYYKSLTYRGHGRDVACH